MSSKQSTAHVARNIVLSSSRTHSSDSLSDQLSGCLETACERKNCKGRGKGRLVRVGMNAVRNLRPESSTRAPHVDLRGTRRYHRSAGWSSLVARWAHNPKVGGSNPPPATKPSQNNFFQVVLSIPSPNCDRQQYKTLDASSFNLARNLHSIFIRGRSRTGAILERGGCQIDWRLTVLPNVSLEVIG